jgi:hypothetical protein
MLRRRFHSGLPGAGVHAFCLGVQNHPGSLVSFPGFVVQAGLQAAKSRSPGPFGHHEARNAIANQVGQRTASDMKVTN